MIRLTIILWSIAVLFTGIVSVRAEEVISSAREYLMMDAETGTVLFARDPDIPIYPASMSKIVTALMVFERLKDGRLSLDDKFVVSENAWRKGGVKTGGSTMFLRPGQRVAVRDLLRGVIVQSGNDACIVLAEGISGTEEAFAQAMTFYARSIGLTGSHFTNSTGWPHPEHYMTARDLALAAIYTIENFPDLYALYAETEFAWNGISQFNRNSLLARDPRVDGIKTGYTKRAGYGILLSAMRNGRRLVLVAGGMKSKKERIVESQRLLDIGFTLYRNYSLFSAGQTVGVARVWLGEKENIGLVLAKDLTLSLSRQDRESMRVLVRYNEPISTPIVAGIPIAQLVVEIRGKEYVSVPLMSTTDVKRMGLLGRIQAAFSYFVWG